MAHGKLWACALPALAVACGLLAPSEPASFGQPIAAPLVSEASGLMVAAAADCSDAWFGGYVMGRVVPVAYADRAPQALGPWFAERDFGATDAREDGSITEWADHYYITHDWSAYGQQVLALVPGDTVTINGRTLRVQDILNYPKDSYYDEIMWIAGADATVLQTCYPDSDYNRIVYGR